MWLQNKKDKLGVWIGWHTPRWLLMWITIGAISRATTGKYGNTDPHTLNVMELLKRIQE